MATKEVDNDRENTKNPPDTEIAERLDIQKMKNERSTPVRKILKASWDCSTQYPPSPLGATPRIHLPQSYKILCDPHHANNLSGYGDDFEKDYRNRDGVLKDTFSRNAQSVFTCIKDRFQAPSVQMSVFKVMGIFVMSSICLGAIYYNFPKLQVNIARHIRIPRNIIEAKRLGKVLIHYKDSHLYLTSIGFILTYVFLQSFAIPGSLLMSILTGFLFSFPVALLMVLLCTSVGASCCYLLSSLAGHNLIYRLFPSYVAKWSKNVKHHESDLLNYIIFLRIAPFIPNSLINILSPVIGIPIYIFFTGTFLGMAAPSFVLVQIGIILNHLTIYGTTTWISFVQLAFFAILSLLPIIFWKKLKEKLD